MKHFTLITLLIVSINAFGQLSPMDRYEKDMKLEYQRHDIASITRYILQNKEVGKSEFVLNGRSYKMKVKESLLKPKYVRNPNSKDIEWVESQSLQFVLKNSGREYHYVLNGNTLQLWSDNLSFMAYFDFEKEEVSIRKIRGMYNTSEPKMYGFDYTFNCEKVQDWIVRDADGRANSMGKVYPKRK